MLDSPDFVVGNVWLGRSPFRLLSNEEISIATKDHEFTVGEGQTIWVEKSHYPDLVHLVVPKDQVVALAQKVLRAYELARPEGMCLDEIPLYGGLEPLEDEQAR